MKRVLKASEILHTQEIKGKAGMLLIQQMAVYAGVLDTKLDISDMTVDDCYYHKGSITEEIEDYTNYLEDEGVLVGYSRYKPSQGIYDSLLVIDTDLFKTRKWAWKKTEECNYWTYQWARSAYGKYLSPKLTKYEHIEYFMIFLIGKELIDVYLKKTTKPLVIDFAEFTQSLLMYMTVLKLENDLQNDNIQLIWNKEVVEERGFDVKYKLFYDECIESGKSGLYTANEKFQFIKDLGMEVGSILVLYERSRLSRYRKWGDIVNANVVQYKGIEQDCVVLNKICVTRTKEDIWEQLQDMPEDKRMLCMDVYYDDAPQYEMVVPVYNLGIEEYLCCEASKGELEQYILSKIDRTTKTQLYTRVGGKLTNCTMSEADGVYWLLMQNHVDFDKELYRKMYYKEGVEPLWEKEHESESH